MANGNSLVMQVGVQTVHETPVVPTKQVQVSSEGFKLNLTKKDEGLLTGGRLSGRVTSMGRKIEGSLSTLSKPDDVGLFIASCLGAEATTTLVPSSTGAYLHTFVAADAGANLPSLTFILDRDVKVFEYSGCKIESMSFNASAEDYLKLDCNIVGRDEDTGTLAIGLSPSPLKSFRFAGATVTVGGVSLEATSIKFDYTNNQDSGLQTTSTGVYYREPEVGARDIKADVEVIYDTNSDDIRDDFFITDAVAQLVINFVSGQEVEAGYPYSLKITMPYCQVEDASPTVSGADMLKYNLQLKATEGVLEPITIELVNGLATEYI